MFVVAIRMPPVLECSTDSDLPGKRCLTLCHAHVLPRYCTAANRRGRLNFVAFCPTDTIVSRTVMNCKVKYQIGQCVYVCVFSVETTVLFVTTI